jgi:hypothetical protein
MEIGMRPVLSYLLFFVLAASSSYAGSPREAYQELIRDFSGIEIKPRLYQIRHLSQDITIGFSATAYEDFEGYSHQNLEDILDKVLTESEFSELESGFLAVAVTPNWIDGNQLFMTRTMSRDCLFYQINLKEKKGRVKWISTQNEGCTFGKKSGRFLLSLVERINKLLGVKTAVLNDHSSIRCQETGQEASLALLHVFQSGETWYEAEGFQDARSDRQQVVSRKRNLRELRDYPLEKIQQELENFFDYLYESPEVVMISSSNSLGGLLKKKNFFQEVIQLFGSKLPSDHQTLGNLMSLLWKEKCSTYMELEPFFLEKTPSHDWEDRDSNFWPAIFPFERIYPTNAIKTHKKTYE